MKGECTVKYIRAPRIKWRGRLSGMDKNKNSEEECGLEAHRNEI
jgi:hypothetical protein